MKFGSLDSASCTIPVYTIGWRIRDDPDKWTRRFLRFKGGEKSDIHGGALVLRDAVLELQKHSVILGNRTGIAVALSSSKTVVDPDGPLGRVGSWLSKTLGATWLGEKLEKKVHRSLHSLSSSSDRDSEVEGAYVCTSDLSAISHIVILDDLVTRGATLGDIIRAIRVAGADRAARALRPAA